MIPSASDFSIYASLLLPEEGVSKNADEAHFDTHSDLLHSLPNEPAAS